MPKVQQEEAAILVIMGVSGSGKTTVAQALVDRLGWAFQEGDDLHPAANVAKMASGTPLGDADRAPWLCAVAAWIDRQIEAGRPAIVTCSALRRRYRDALRRPEVVFVLLQAPTALLHERLVDRRNHFMGPALLDSQLDALEPLGDDEQHLSVESSGDPAAQAAWIADRLGLKRAEA